MIFLLFAESEGARGFLLGEVEGAIVQVQKAAIQVNRSRTAIVGVHRVDRLGLVQVSESFIAKPREMFAIFELGISQSHELPARLTPCAPGRHRSCAGIRGPPGASIAHVRQRAREIRDAGRQVLRYSSIAQVK